MLKSKGLQEKKAQVTLFVIIAAVILVGIIIFFSIKPTLKRAPTVTEPQAYIEKCMKDAASEALDLLSKQGGTISPASYVLYDNNKVSYLCYTDYYYSSCTNQNPLLKNYIEEQVTDYASPKVQECVSTLKNELLAKGYEVSTGALTLTTSLEPKKVVVKADVPITVSKEETKKFDKFETTVLSPIYEQAILAQEIVNSEIEYGDFEQLSYMLYHQGTDIEKKMIGDNTIYLLEDRGSGKSFLFAIQNYVMPPGF